MYNYIEYYLYNLLNYRVYYLLLVQFLHQLLDIIYAKFLQKARLQNKISQKDLATKLHVPAKTVQLWESGKQIIPGNQIGNLNRTLKVNFKKNQLIL